MGWSVGSYQSRVLGKVVLSQNVAARRHVSHNLGRLKLEILSCDRRNGPHLGGEYTCDAFSSYHWPQCF